MDLGRSSVAKLRCHQKQTVENKLPTLGHACQSRSGPGVLLKKSDGKSGLDDVWIKAYKSPDFKASMIPLTNHHFFARC
jgi:hypothetical protein